MLKRAWSSPSVMKKERMEVVVYMSRQRLLQLLLSIGFLYLLLVSVEVPFVFRRGLKAMPQEEEESFNGHRLLATQDNNNNRNSDDDDDNKNSNNNADEERIPPSPVPARPNNNTAAHKSTARPARRVVSEREMVSTLVFDEKAFRRSGTLYETAQFLEMAKASSERGRRVWDELRSGRKVASKRVENRNTRCPQALYLTGTAFSDRGRVMDLPCGLAAGSNIALVGKPRLAEVEKGDQRQQYPAVSEFRMELLGLSNADDDEELPRIFHFNPRLKGDWSGKPVIELNTHHGTQWGSPIRCQGLQSKDDDQTVDGKLKCEKWVREEDSPRAWWSNKVTSGKKEGNSSTWEYPFAEDKYFVLTLNAGLEGYHVNVDGRHVASFPFRNGFPVSDAAGIHVDGDIDIHSIFSTSLPKSNPSLAPRKPLEMLRKWQAPPLPKGPVELFIGILSAGHHFAQRMAIRKSWMQHKILKFSIVVARFFVALHASSDVNVELKKEAEYFGDIVIVPFMDDYDLVVLKTVAICEYGVRMLAAKYIMKIDDDTFVRPDVILRVTKRIPAGRSLYYGNINYNHKPMRSGKWAVTPEEWLDEVYPPYANGAGYVLSSDIAHFIVSEFHKHELRLFRMEDVSVGMWVEQYSRSANVQYLHSLKFCQSGCIGNYITAHYQSPRQMICLWNRIKQGRAECCYRR